MTPKSRKEKKGLGSSTISHTKSYGTTQSTEFSFKLSQDSSPERQNWMNKELILLMESKAVLEKGFLSLKQSSSASDARQITSDTYVTLLNQLFETIPTDRRGYLRE